ncbi:GTP 3',8-cyclase MoaA [Serpentinicella alkaliphila]|uniref:GTP 3',8-cyclase n=1 Tax=Serpentinicella alkaliphila TaxID=1734049 RepID=A0A4V2T576_9FIRM|nr:GTP 3',8-cyclase MoaA [Serpentinicella alkaliphila]QUH26846.1 GTP 3',8-cyclase MoaA [Serpentinicella alkaliphila]TCQ08074.1 cyclic pyranopterin monophosphate synthase subunit MoaA [Serpentinicella alkaliphila]
MKDQYNREINYLRLSVTDLCNLKCQYCMPADGVDKKSHNEILRIESYTKLVEAMTKLGVNKVRLTGGEPLVRRGILDLVKTIGSMREVKDLSITTNGVLLKDYAQKLKEAGLNRVNISLDTLNPVKYKKITRGGNFEEVINGIGAAKEAGLLPIKINVVVINHFNTDEIMDFIRLADEHVEVRFIELMPVGEVATWNKQKFISNQVLIDRYMDLFESQDSVYNGPAEYFIKKDNQGKVGFISSISDHFCNSCNRIRLTADGKLKLCLHSNREIDIKEALKLDANKLLSYLEDLIFNKPDQHYINDTEFIPVLRNMVGIGG